MLNREEEEGTHLWTFEKITNHRKATVNGKQIMEVEVLWDTWEKTWEPLNVMKMDDPVSCGSICQGKESTRPTILVMGKQVCQKPKEMSSGTAGRYV